MSDPLDLRSLTQATATRAPGADAAQLAELQRRVKAGERVAVTDREGRRTQGRFVRTSEIGLVIRVNNQERTTTWESLGRVEKVDSVWDGILIGGAVGAGLGAGLAGLSCSPDCASRVPEGAAILGGIGAGIGALVDWGYRDYSVAIYGPKLAGRNAISQGTPVTSVGELWTKVREGDPIRVLAANGEKIIGTFVSSSPDSIVVRTDGRIRELPADSVREVKRVGSNYRMGAIVGAVLGMAGGSVLLAPVGAMGLGHRGAYCQVSCRAQIGSVERRPD